MLEMKVRGLTLDPLSNMALVVLRDLEDTKALPIWVGIPEANAIALELEQVPTPRPMTHDLIKNILEGIQASVVRIVVNDLRDSTFFATIFLSLQEQEFCIDARPSDAIAIALRAKAPIFVALDVIERVGTTDVNAQNTADETEGLKEWLDNIKPEDFGKL
ncbi:MAG: bifunctional nuclease family protein [Candidatus Tectomicrobia bacterium]|nr:bifunctional nuclease family protein [Candidatus Tectomicrobia bacterium]MCY4563114.1 bifunctional nuclease family protein [Gammaproteobacteria bacterium]